MTETTPKRPGRKRLSKDGVIMSERVSMSCTPDELAMLQEAIKYSERDNISSFMRSVVVPYARQLVTNRRMASLADMMSSPKSALSFFEKMFFDVDETTGEPCNLASLVKEMARMNDQMETLQTQEAIEKKKQRTAKDSCPMPRRKK